MSECCHVAGIECAVGLNKRKCPHRAAAHHREEKEHMTHAKSHQGNTGQQAQAATAAQSHPESTRVTTYAEIQQHLTNGTPFQWLETQKLGSGYAAVHFWINLEEKDLGPFAEPYNTGFGRYATRAEAYRELIDWAKSDELPYIKDRS